MGIDPVTHKPFSHLMAEIATTLPPPQVAHLAEAALGCFKDEMLHLLTKKRIDFQLQRSSSTPGYDVPQPAGVNTAATFVTGRTEDKDDTIQKIKLGVSRAMQEPDALPTNKPWTITSTGETSDGFARDRNTFPVKISGFQYGPPSYGNEGDGSAWSQSMCTGSTCTGGDQQGRLHEKAEEEDGEEAEGGKAARKESSMFNSDCVLWDLSDDLMNPIV
nr:TPA_asm: hypothetical protein HUJ06_025716 [Nelumbo nucifera]